MHLLFWKVFVILNVQQFYRVVRFTEKLEDFFVLFSAYFLSHENGCEMSSCRWNWVFRIKNAVPIESKVFWLLLFNNIMFSGVFINCMLICWCFIVFFAQGKELLLFRAEELLLAFTCLFDWSDGGDSVDLSNLIWWDSFFSLRSAIITLDNVVLRSFDNSTHLKPSGEWTSIRYFKLLVR